MHECGMRTAALIQWQDTKLHARMRTVSLLQWQDTKLHARMRHAHCCPDSVAGYQTACAHGCPAAVAGSQIASLSKGEAKMQQQQQQSRDLQI
jgi:hypothetical protein